MSELSGTIPSSEFQSPMAGDGMATMSSQESPQNADTGAVNVETPAAAQKEVVGTLETDQAAATIEAPAEEQSAPPPMEGNVEMPEQTEADQFGGENEYFEEEYDQYENEEDQKVSNRGVIFDPTVIKDVEAECTKAEAMWQDPVFPAADFSLYEDTSAGPEYASHSVVHYWKRPDQINPRCEIYHPQRPAGNVDNPNDAIPFLDTLWLSGPLSILNIRGEIVERLFSHDQYMTQHGFMAISLFKDGGWKEILIDTQIPCGPDNQPAYGRVSNSDEMWLPLVEKAYAKYYGSYEALNQRQTIADTFVDLTGGSVEILNPAELAASHDKNVVWNWISRWYSEGCVLATQLGGEDNITDEGIMPNRLYGVVDIYGAEDTMRLVRVRNPWGQPDYTGPFADHDAMWNKHPELKVNLHYEPNPDGTFWMPFDNWLQSFDQLYLCHLFPDSFHQTTTEGAWEGSAAAGPPTSQGKMDISFAEPAPGDMESSLNLTSPTLNKSFTTSLASPMGSGSPVAKSTFGATKSDPDACFFLNPQFHVSFPEKARPEQTVYFSLMQCEDDGPIECTNFLLQKISKGNKGRVWDFKEPPIFRAVDLDDLAEPRREVNRGETLNLNEDGHHFVIVAYQDYQRPDPNVRRRFFLRSFSECEIKITPIAPPHTQVFEGKWEAHSAGGPTKVKGLGHELIPNVNWCRNPQLFLHFKQNTQLKIVLERATGRRKAQQNLTVGFTVANAKDVLDTAMAVATQAGSGGRRAQQAIREAANEGLGTPDRKLQILSSDKIREDTAFNMEEVACMFMNASPAHGPLCVIPALSEVGATAPFTISIYSDRPLAESIILNEAFHKVRPGAWTRENAGGCHIYEKPGSGGLRAAGSVGWTKNPKFLLHIPPTGQKSSFVPFRITLARLDAQWSKSQQLTKDQISCMLGFYVLGPILADSEEAVLNFNFSKSHVKDETDFRSAHEVTKECPLQPGHSYLIVPCTYEPGKYGDFMLRVSSPTETPFKFKESGEQGRK